MVIQNRLSIPPAHINCYELMAGLIAANEHDFVIEGASGAGEPDVYRILAGRHRWRGRYATVNTSFFEGGKEVYMTTPEDLRKRMGEPPCHIPTAGDCIDDARLNAILDIANPLNPAYAVNSAIGWVLGQAAKERAFAETAEMWADNLTRTRLKHAYFTDAVDTGLDGEWASYWGVGKRVYEMFCGQLRRNGWEIEEREGIMTPHTDGNGKVGKLLVAHR